LKIIVELNSRIDSFQIKEVHRSKLISEYPEHDFVFLDHPQTILKALTHADMALVWRFKSEWYELAPHLKHVYTPAAGKDWVEEDSTGRVQTHFSTFHGRLIAESFMSMLLHANHDLRASMDQQKQKVWNPNGLGQRRSLSGQTLLILGFGNIAKYCARVALTFGMKVVGTSRRDQNVSEVSIVHPKYLDETLPLADHVLNLLPGGSETHHHVNEHHFKLMKRTACFYNFGRGTTVDEQALCEALSERLISFAGLDVTEKEPLPSDSPLWSSDRVLLTPHSSCCYEDYLDFFIEELGQQSWESQ
jgi:D-2-hydroxyacid dehydrogenase (NADP+)